MTSVGLPTPMMPVMFEGTGCVQVNVLNYLQSIISCQATANPIMDSPITALIVQMLRAPQQGAFQVLLATILGLLVRHCTFIPAELADCGESLREFLPTPVSWADSLRESSLICARSADTA